MTRKRDKTVDANEYQHTALRFANAGLSKQERLMNAALGLAGEAGEFADMVKKARFQGHDFDRNEAIKELGDLCWYVALGAQALNIPLGEVMNGNVIKLARRYKDGRFSVEASRNRNEENE